MLRLFNYDIFSKNQLLVALIFYIFPSYYLFIFWFMISFLVLIFSFVFSSLSVSMYDFRDPVCWCVGSALVLLVVWHELSSTGACRQLCGASSWCWYGYLWEHASWLIFPGPGNSLAVQCSGLGTTTPEAQAQSLTREPRTLKPQSVTREKTIKRN